MTIADLGCGQGGFTSALARVVGANGKVLAVDISYRYLMEFMERLDKYGVKNRVTFVRADAADLKSAITDGVVDMAVSFRLLEELKRPEGMADVVSEMVRIIKRNGKICVTEISTNARNEAEEAYIRLHRESGDSLFRPDEVVEAMKRAQLRDVRVITVDSDIWFSPELAKQDLGFAQVWFDADVERNLGGLIDEYGMKYPALVAYSGKKGLAPRSI
jgi:cyclopropane fatty-acyl-phospholipid synthase-like methyltransferase